MKTKIIVGGLFGGIVYALIMAGFDYATGENFSMKKFILGGTFFGIFQGAIAYFSLKSQREGDGEKN